MNDPRDNDTSGTPADGQPRKPRIEVLQRGPAAAQGSRSGQAPDNSGIDAARNAAPGASAAQASWIANPPPQAGTVPGPRRRGPLRSPTTLLVILACLVIAGFLLYTYLSSERGVQASEKGTQLSAEDAELVGNSETVSGPATAEEPTEPPAAESIDDGAVPEAEPAASPASQPPPQPESQPAPQPAPPRAAAPEARPEVADTPEAPPALKSETEAEADAADTVRAFYSALGAGDGASAARFVIPAKRGSGPLSAGALTRYYSSFRRPLRVRRIVPVNADTVRVAYD